MRIAGEQSAELVLSSATMKSLANWVTIGSMSTLLATGLLAASGGAPERPALVWVEAPGARLGTVRRLSDEDFLLWLDRAIEQDRLRPLPAEQAPRLDSLRAAVRRIPTANVDAGFRSSPAAGHVVLDLAGALREADVWMDARGRPTAAFAGGWTGDSEWGEIRRIAGIDDRLRWEEVEEFLSLSATQNHAVRSMPPSPEHPIWRLRRAYTADKFFANAAIFFGRTGGAERVFLTTELVLAYETDLMPWSERLLQENRPADGQDPGSAGAQRRLFLRRLRSSGPRIYGRFDRLLQSLQATWGPRAVIVVDAADSPDPFVAVQAPIPWSRKDAAPDDLRELLERVGWLPRGPGGEAASDASGSSAAAGAPGTVGRR